jgi:hypothetical protein
VLGFVDLDQLNAFVEDFLVTGRTGPRRIVAQPRTYLRLLWRGPQWTLQGAMPKLPALPNRPYALISMS